MRATAVRRELLLAAFVFTLAATPALAAPGQARLIAPAGDITGSTVVFSWAAVPSSTWYLLWFGTQSGSQFQKLVEEWYTADQAGCAGGGTCSVSLTLGYPAGSYVWFIRTWNSTGYGPWSVASAFTTKELTPTWSRRLDPARRFTLVLDGLAAVDNETGLTWARTPETATSDWNVQGYQCMLLKLGNRAGWRMPSMSEILSLASPTLPTGHPFTVGATPKFWTATPYGSAGNVLVVDLAGTAFIFQDQKTASYRVWCVRGPGLELR